MTLGVALVAGEVLTLAVAVGALQRSVTSIPDMPAERGAALKLKEALPFAANGLLAMAYNRFDVVILAALASTAQLALYAPASRIQDALYVLPSSIGIIGLPLVAAAVGGQRAAEGIAILVKRLVFLGLAISVPLTVALFVFAPQAIRFVLGADYSGSTTPTRILIWFLPLAALTAPLLAALAGAGHSVETTKVFAVAFTVAMLGHASLDWWLGATGGAVASLLRDPAALLAAYFFAVRAGLLRKPVRPRTGGIFRPLSE
jgi:O-antigen/teichoic acid export membrane protein